MRTVSPSWFRFGVPGRLPPAARRGTARLDRADEFARGLGKQVLSAEGTESFRRVRAVENRDGLMSLRYFQLSTTSTDTGAGRSAIYCLAHAPYSITCSSGIRPASARLNPVPPRPSTSASAIHDLLPGHAVRFHVSKLACGVEHTTLTADAPARRVYAAWMGRQVPPPRCPHPNGGD